MNKHKNKSICALLILCCAAMSGCPDVAQVTAADPQDPGQGGVLEIRYVGRSAKPDAQKPQKPEIKYPAAGDKL